MTGRAAKKKLEKLTAIMRRLDWLAAIMRVHLRIGTILELEKISRIDPNPNTNGMALEAGSNETSSHVLVWYAPYI